MKTKTLFFNIFIWLVFYGISSSVVNASSVGNIQEKHIVAKITELEDNSGLVYVGALISQADVSVYLQQMQSIVDNKVVYQQLRANQSSRDHQSFHVTLINPYEYQTIKNKVKLGENIRLTLHGLGRVQKTLSLNNKQSKTKQLQQSYFVVVSSADGQYFRQQYLLKPKDFHITLGFNPQDIYDMSKGKERLLDDYHF